MILAFHKKFAFGTALRRFGIVAVSLFDRNLWLLAAITFGCGESCPVRVLNLQLDLGGMSGAKLLLRSRERRT